MELTPEYLNRLQAEWNAIAGVDPTPVRIQSNAPVCIYAFGTELQCLRLAYKYRNPKIARVKAHGDSWLFTLYTRISPIAFQ